MKIDLGNEGILLCEETYSADLASVFYDVRMILKDADGKEFSIGNLTFHDDNWSERIEVKRIGDWLIFPLNGQGYARLIMINKLSGKQCDTTLIPYDLRKDELYRLKHKDFPDHLSSGGSKIDEISENMIEVTYEYDAKASYPPMIHVNQKVEYEFDQSTGLIVTKHLFDRVFHSVK